jgi:hypothetical protein
MSRLPFAACLAFAIVWSAGCGSSQSGPPLAPVKGVVNIEGKPVPSGEVHFAVPGAAPKVLEIKGGAFSGEAPVGKNHVEVYIYTEGAPVEKYGGTRAKTNTAPAQYWGPNSILAATVSASEPNDFQFALSAQGGRNSQDTGKPHH